MIAHPALPSLLPRWPLWLLAAVALVVGTHGPLFAALPRYQAELLAGGAESRCGLAGLGPGEVTLLLRPATRVQGGVRVEARLVRGDGTARTLTTSTAAAPGGTLRVTLPVPAPGELRLRLSRAPLSPVLPLLRSLIDRAAGPRTLHLAVAARPECGTREL